MTDAMMGQLRSLLGTGLSFISQHLKINQFLVFLKPELGRFISKITSWYKAFNNTKGTHYTTMNLQKVYMFGKQWRPDWWKQWFSNWEAGTVYKYCLYSEKQFVWCHNPAGNLLRWSKQMTVKTTSAIHHSAQWSSKWQKNTFLMVYRVMGDKPVKLNYLNQ